MAHYDDEGFGNPTYKILFLGPSNSGKTSLIQSYIQGRPAIDHPKTNNVFCAVKEFRGKNKYKLQLWDTGGKLSTSDLISSQIHQSDAIYKNTKVVVIAFDLANKESFELLSHYIDLVQGKVPNVPVVLVGNKSDQVSQITAQQINDFVQSKKITTYFSASAKNYSNVQEVFFNLIGLLNIKQTKNEAKLHSFPVSPNKRAVLISKLEAYIRRIASYKNAEGQINFEHGFWYLGPFYTKESRAFNRQINYNIAGNLLQSLRNDLDESVENIFSKVGNVRRMYLDIFNATKDPTYVDRGIWGELRSIIRMAGEPLNTVATERTRLTFGEL